MVVCGFARIIQITCLINLSALACATAAAQDTEGGLSGSVAVQAGLAPDYEGSDDYRLIPYIALRLQWKDRYLQTEGAGVILNLVPSPILNAGPAVNYRPERDDDVDSVAVAALDEVDAAVEVGGFVSLGFDGLWAVGDRLETKAKLLFDVADTHDGMVVEVSAAYNRPLGADWWFGVGAFATYADGGYHRTYFGIDAANAAQSGLPTFEADSGLKDAGVYLASNYALYGNWGLAVTLGYTRLLGDAADSPLTAQEGDANQYFGAVGLSYRF